MSPSEAAQRWELLELCERALDGGLDEEARLGLEQRLRDDPAARAVFAAALQQHAELRADERLIHDLASEVVDESAAPPQRFIRRVAAIAAMLGLLLGGAALFRSGRPSSPAVATVVKASHCRWAGSTLPTAEGSRVGTGTLELAEGLATLRFDSGAEIVMEAPATLEILSAMNCRLIRGTLVANVPPSAKGFSVDTQAAKVVDYGTRFGVSAGDDGKYMVQVIEGLVEVNHKADKEVRQLRGGQSVDRGLLRQKVNPQAADAEPNHWQPNVVLDAGDGWQVISTAYGRGRDSCIQSAATAKNFGRDPFFRVKRSSIQQDLNRKGYLCFDIAGFKGRTISDAELVLSIEPSDLGFASLVPDSTFAVYGLTDGPEDEWSEDGLSWRSAPAHDPDQPQRNLPMPGKAELLGRFEIGQGVNRGTRKLGGRALLDFLRRDTNGMVTLIICRETDETAKGGFVHAFATKESPSNTPPLLRLKSD
jgi:ferric-dicitrate binding protein FerR (iron transport regulator)